MEVSRLTDELVRHTLDEDLDEFQFQLRFVWTKEIVEESM